MLNKLGGGEVVLLLCEGPWVRLSWGYEINKAWCVPLTSQLIMETDTKRDVRYRRLVRVRGVRMLWVSTLVERGTVHYGSTEEACPIPSGEVMDGGCSSLSLFS